MLLTLGLSFQYLIYFQVKKRRKTLLLTLPSFERVLAVLSDVVLPEVSVLASVVALDMVILGLLDLRDELTDSVGWAGVLAFIKR